MTEIERFKDFDEAEKPAPIPEDADAPDYGFTTDEAIMAIKQMQHLRKFVVDNSTVLVKMLQSTVGDSVFIYPFRYAGSGNPFTKSGVQGDVALKTVNGDLYYWYPTLPSAVEVSPWMPADKMQYFVRLIGEGVLDFMEVALGSMVQADVDIAAEFYALAKERADKWHAEHQGAIENENDT